ncbi:hypothetical protein Tco_1401590 [Tanacetum coccineum]
MAVSKMIHVADPTSLIEPGSNTYDFQHHPFDEIYQDTTKIMPPRMTTRSADRSTVAPQGGRTVGQTSRRSGKTRGRTGNQGNQGNNQGNNRNQNGDAVNDKIQGDVRYVIMGNGRRGYSYKEFLACNPKEYVRKGGVMVYTRWIEKMESVQDMSRCGDGQKVKYIVGSFVGKTLTWWNYKIHTRGQETAVGMA